MDFAIGLVNSVLNVPNGQVKFFEEFRLQRNCEINSADQNVFGATVEMVSKYQLYLTRKVRCKNDFLCTLLIQKICLRT